MLELDRAYHKDCIKGLKQVPSGKAQLVIVDPPFNVGYRYKEYKDDRADYWPWTKHWIKECHRVLSPTGSIYIKQITQNVFQTGQILKDLGMEFQNLIVWKSIPCFPHKVRFNRQYEVILFFTKNKEHLFNTYVNETQKEKTPWGRDRKQRSTKLYSDLWLDIPMVYTGTVNHPEAIFKNKRESFKKAHPCQMPEELARRMINFSSNPGDLVIDPQCGSGTVLVAAKQLGRHYLGYDIVLEYIKVTEKRLKQAGIMQFDDSPNNLNNYMGAHA